MEQTGPRIILVVAFSLNHVIGQDNRLPWHLPNDLQHFKALTAHQTILMGRKTYQSIGRPLKNRDMIVLTRSLDFKSDYARVIHDLKELEPLKGDLYIIGGSEIYTLLLLKADLIYATLVKTKITGDTLFPPLDPMTWKEVAREVHTADADHLFNYDFVTYARVRPDNLPA